MPRRARVVRREVPPDPRFGNRVVQRFINKIMYDGKKSTAERIVYGALDLLEQQLHRNPVDVFELALRNVTPEEACAHPNWVMGRKISVDSATMMNKALEVIEARYLFGLAPSRLEVVSPDGGEVLGSARRVERTRFRWLAWLWPPEVAFHENGDEPLLFVMRRRRGAAPRWHVRDADDWTVGRIVGPRLLDRLDRPLAPPRHR